MVASFTWVVREKVSDHAAVGCGGDELGVAGEVAGVAEDHSAAGGVAEDRRPRLVPAGSRGLGGPVDPAPLLAQGGRGDQRPARVTADEAGHVRRSRDDPARRPHAGGAEHLADVLRGLRWLDVVAVHVRLGHLVALREARVAQAERPVDEPSQQLLVALAGRRLGHQRDRDVVGVRVLVPRSRPEQQWVTGHVVEQPARVEVVVRIGGEDLDELGTLRVVGQSAGVVQQLAQCHGVPLPRQ